jgi:hypothetical protein
MKLANAMREVHNDVPKNVKKTGKAGMAKERMLRAIAFSKAGQSNKPPNYVSRNELHVDSGASSGTNHASKTVPYKPLKDLSGGTGQITPELLKDKGHGETGSKVPLDNDGPGPSAFEPGIDTVKAVTRELNPVERARQKNNRTRDMRTNLGRGKSSQPTIDAGGQTPTR